MINFGMRCGFSQEFPFYFKEGVFVARNFIFNRGSQISLSKTSHYKSPLFLKYVAARDCKWKLFFFKESCFCIVSDNLLKRSEIAFRLFTKRIEDSFFPCELQKHCFKLTFSIFSRSYTEFEKKFHFRLIIFERSIQQ